MELIKRPRRLRSSKNIRDLVRETHINKDALIYPVFIAEGKNIKEEIKAMPGQYRYSPDRMEETLQEAAKAGVKNILLFGIPANKDEMGSAAYDENGVIQQALRKAKSDFPELLYITDVCMCEYTSHGHCGALKGRKVDNDASVELLSMTALSQVQAGADMVAPSDMMDGRVGAIRQTLDKNGYTDIPIMSYAVKYASSFYGPFREAAGSAPAFGDRKSYQMDPANSDEALKEVLLDIEEGADIVIVKPAASYLDIVRRVKDTVNIPVAAYSVSGEYAMVKAAAAAGYINEERVMCEMALGAIRAGAGIYITYFAKELARCIEKGLI